ncbi:hypothetical protein [Spirochaeta cellobiosiphila]|uniref:hypothetical protein n=1 Tax=Spirochaeta cellobiosiphila TaxID=504483 RepID=UPI0004143B66|nr:hypothetical protein [Spirochaeta cellobiosiphila]
MNIAFSAFYLICLLLPGYIFLYAFNKKENTSVEHSGVDRSFVLAVILSTLIHLIGTSIVRLMGYTINVDISIKILTGCNLVQDELDILEACSVLISIYFMSVFISSFLFGKFLQIIVLQLFPYKDSPFSYNTPWFYDLRGLISKDVKADITKITCLVDFKDSAYLYRGILEEFHLNKDGSLDRIILKDAMKKRIHKDSPGSFNSIRGNKMIIKYEDIKNMNIQYYNLNIEDDSKEQPSYSFWQVLVQLINILRLPSSERDKIIDTINHSKQDSKKGD